MSDARNSVEVVQDAAEVNGVELYFELHGDGEPLALVHGSWSDGTEWNPVVPALAENFRVLVYDRRGHSRSGRPVTPGSVDEDGEDLAALLAALELAPAHVVANSFGGNIALRLACRRPEIFRSLSCHEPPLVDLLGDDPASEEVLQHTARCLEAVGRRIAEGDHEGAARQFAEEIALGPGAWGNELSAEERAVWVQNAGTFLDELQDPGQTTIDRDQLARLEIPVQLTNGSESPPLFLRVVDHLVEAIPRGEREAIDGAEHAPHVTTPERYAAAIMREARRASV